MTDATTSPTDRLAAAFVARLRSLADEEDRGALAALRRSLQDPHGMAAAACPYVVPYLPPTEDLTRDRAYFLVGALFALHADAGGEDVSLGHAFRAMNDAQEGVGKPDNESLRGRFVALLDADAEDLPDHLRHAVSLARAKQKPLDWYRLLRDVLGWGHPSRYVQRRLAREFWMTPHDAFDSQGETTR